MPARSLYTKLFLRWLVLQTQEKKCVNSLSRLKLHPCWKNVWWEVWSIGQDGVWEGMVELGLSGRRAVTGVLEQHVTLCPCWTPCLRPWTYSEHSAKYWVEGLNGSLEGMSLHQGPTGQSAQWAKVFGRSEISPSCKLIYSMWHYLNCIFFFFFFCIFIP